MEDQAVKQGVCFQIRDGWLGAFHSADGPKLFYNQDVYLLEGPDWDFECFAGKESGLFIFYWHGERRISIKAANRAEWMHTLFDFLRNIR